MRIGTRSNGKRPQPGAVPPKTTGPHDALECAMRQLGRPSRWSLEANVIRTESAPGTPATQISAQQLAQLLRAVSSGDRVAFEHLYSATSRKLYGIVVRIVGQRGVADEVLQDAYLRIWQHAARFDPTLGSPIAWMAAIARNCALDAANRAARPNMSVQPELLELPFASDPLTQYERAEDAQRVHACLARLEPEQREVIVQAYCLGMSRQDIAKRTGRPVSTVKTWLRRSLAQLKSCLDEGINAECHLRNVACAAGHSPVIECAPRSTTITCKLCRSPSS
jgi:RNA polymerase sigma-70 factor, ECF subfamily